MPLKFIVICRAKLQCFQATSFVLAWHYWKLACRFFFLFPFLYSCFNNNDSAKAAVTKSWAFLRASYLLYYLNNNNLRFIFNALRILFCDNYRLPIFSNRYREIHVYIIMVFHRLIVSCAVKAAES